MQVKVVDGVVLIIGYDKLLHRHMGISYWVSHSSTMLNGYIIYM